MLLLVTKLPIEVDLLVGHKVSGLVRLSEEEEETDVRRQSGFNLKAKHKRRSMFKLVSGCISLLLCNE